MNTNKKAIRPPQMFDAPLIAGIRAIAARGLRNLRKPRADRRLQLVETLPLGGKRQLILVRCDGSDFLVGAGSDGVSAITPIAPTRRADEACATSVTNDVFDTSARSVLQ